MVVLVTQTEHSLTKTLRGDGTGATFTVVVASGAVSTVTAVAVGGGATQASQYTFADCNIDAISGIGTPSTSAIVVPIISPRLTVTVLMQSKNLVVFT